MRKKFTILTAVVMLLALWFPVTGWGQTSLSTSDLVWPTPQISEDFNSLATYSNTVKTDVANYTANGAFNKMYNNNTSNSYAISNSTAFGTSTKALLLTAGSGSPLIAGISKINNQTITFGTTGAFSIKIAKADKCYFGFYSAGNNTLNTNNACSIYLRNTSGKIEIHGTGSTWNEVVNYSSNTYTDNVIEVCVVYNNTTYDTTYGNNISLTSKTAHVFVNGSCIMNGDNPKSFTLLGSALTDFRVGPQMTSGNKCTVDDVVIYNSLPTAPASTDPSCTIDPTSWDFGEVQAGTSVITKQFTVTTANLTDDLSVEILDGTYYSVDIDEILSTETSKTLTVSLNPTAVGSMDDYLIISGADLEDNIEVELTANGLCNAPENALEFDTPVNLTLSGDEVEYTLAPKANTGNGGSIAYTLTTNPGDNGMIEGVVFSAVETGTYVVTATQDHSGTTCGDTFEITINVVGTTPTCTITPDEWDFGTVAVGGSSQKTFTVTTANLTGNVTLAIDNDAFSVSPTTIPQNATSTEITITFAPTAAGTEVEYLTANGGGISNDELAYLGGTGATPFTITFNAGTGTCTPSSMSGTSGTEITLPTAEPSSACATEGWTFAGWSTTPVSETTDTPTLLNGSYTISGNTTLYAVYKLVEIENVITEFNVADYADENDWESGTKYPTVSISPITFTATGGGNDGKYYSTDETWRFYKSTNGTVSISATNNNITTVTSNPSRTFTIANGSASFVSSSADTKFKSITVTTSNSTTTYNSNPSCLETVATPTFSPAAGSYTTIQNVEINCETEDATIYYTTDGTAPTTTSTQYTSAIEVSESKTIKAIAVKEGMNNSAVAEAAYTIDLVDVATPTFTPASGTTFFTEGLTVTIECATAGATIHYTLNGNDPTSASDVYNGAISLTTTTTIKAIAMKNGMDNSSIATASYIYTDPNAPGTRNNPMTVAQARTFVQNLSGNSNEVYVSGIIYSAGSVSSGSITYWISDDGTGNTSSNDGIQVYKGKGLNGEDFVTGDIYVDEGERVIVKGEMSYYNNTKCQFNSGSKLVLYVYGYSTNSYDCYKVIEGYGNNPGDYYFITSPVAINPDTITDMTDGNNDFDLYYFDQAEEKEWRNYETDKFELTPGKGYLYASKEDVVLNFYGEPTATSTTLSKTLDEFGGMNLVGNPLGVNAYINRSFYIMNSEGTEIIVSPRTHIFPMEGIFVNATSDGETLTFYSTAPNEGTNNNNGKVNVNLSQVVNTRGNSHSSIVDRAVVRFGGNDMLPKFQMNLSSTKVYIPKDGKDYAVVSAEARGEMPVNFKAAKNGTYTISVETENLEVSYLHLIDNMTGENVDLLQTPSYTFTGKTSDYASRFRLVFNANNLNENDSDETFAFISNDNIVVMNEGEATLQVIDMLGRVIETKTLNGNATIGTQANGVYVLRLINGDNVKTQKIVVK